MFGFLNTFFFVFHLILVLFILFGWIWEKTRVANLIALLLTCFSWFILGIWYGLGYCPCTDWHWQVRLKLGFYDMPDSYIKFLIDSLTGLNINPEWVDALTLVLYFLALFASVFTNVRHWRKKKIKSDTH